MAVGGVPNLIATVSDFETSSENLVVVVGGIAAEDVTITATGDIIWSPAVDEIGQSYNVTITVTDESSNVTTTGFAVVVVRLDTDGDGLFDDQEIAIGTDPNNFDTDGDTLGDGFEARATGGVVDPLVPDDPNADPDGDGLSNLDEDLNGVDPGLEDTDGDGTNDGDEVDQGSDPNDPTDGGMPPDEDDVVRVILTIGDPSGSNSESYRLKIGNKSLVGGPCVGVPCDTRTLDLKRGESYEIQIIHVSGPGDLDYTASVVVDAGETDPYFLDDPSGILGGHNNVAASFLNNTATLYLPTGNLTAYRPMQTTNGYAPFTKTAVKDADEKKTDLGPGIRINNDDDNGNGLPDRNESNRINNENDLIEVLIEGLPGGYDGFVLETDLNVLRVWTSADKGQQIFFPSGGMQSEPLDINANGELTIYVEWRSITHGTEELKLVDQNTGFVFDTLVFHSFESIVIGFSGDTTGSSIGINIPALQQPTYDIAVDFYEAGYDVFYYDVNTHSLGAGGGFTGAAFGEVGNAVSNRNVENVAIYGWSHGGGATALLANTLELGKGQGILPNTFEIAATAYIDAVRFDGLGTLNPFSENRRPLQDFGITKPHANWYQTTRQLLPPYTDALPFGGESVPGSVIDVDLTQQVVAISGINHVNIAELVSDQKLLLNFFEQTIPTR